MSNYIYLKRHSYLIKMIGVVIVFFAIAFQNLANAGISLNLTRIIIEQTSKEGGVRIQNEGGYPVLIQAWIDSGERNALPEDIVVPFVISSPLFRLDANTVQHLRILFTGTKSILPNDRESVFWLNIQEVPPAFLVKEGEDYMQIAFRTRIKIFYRPPQIPFDTVSLHEQLKFEVVEHDGHFALKVHNPTPIHVTFLKINMYSNTKELLEICEPEDSMVAPYSSLIVPLAHIDQMPARNAWVNYVYLDDFGVPIETPKIPLEE